MVRQKPVLYVLSRFPLALVRFAQVVRRTMSSLIRQLHFGERELPHHYLSSFCD